MKNLIVFLTLITFFCACNADLVKKDKQEKKDAETNKINKGKIIKELNSKYNISYKWDTLHSNYEIDYKPVINSDYQLIADFRINNIYEKDSSEYISIMVGDLESYKEYPYYYFDFPITQEQEKKIRQKDVILVVCIKKIKKIKFAIESDQYGEDVTINLKNSNDFSGEGKIIEIIKLPIK